MPAEGSPGGRRRTWWVVGAAAALVVVLGIATAAVVLSRSGDDQRTPPGAWPSWLPTAPPAITDAPPSEACDPPSWSGEITAEGSEGSGGTQVPLDGLPDHLFFYVTFSYTPPGNGLDYFQVNQVVDGQEYAFIHRDQPGAVTGSGLLQKGDGERAPTALVVNTEGAWTLRIQEFLATPTWPEITEGDSGSTHMRVEPGTLNGPTRGVADHDGYFSISVYTDRAPLPGLPVTSEQLAVGREGGSTDFVLPANTCLVAISAESGWTLTLL